mgnify:FL=1
MKNHPGHGVIPPQSLHEQADIHNHQRPEPGANGQGKQVEQRGSGGFLMKHELAHEADAWLTPRRFAALLAVFIVALYPDVVLGSRTFYYRDFQIFGYAWANHHRDSFWRGEMPLWNPLSNCGLPFLAQWNTITLYPLSLVYLLLPLSLSLGLFCLLHLFVGGMGMYFLAWRWTGSRLGAAFAGLAFALNGLALNSLAWPNNVSAIGWMPWVVLLADKAWRGGTRDLVRAALAAGVQLLSGAPEIIFLTWVLLGTLWLRECVIEKESRVRILRRFIFLVALATGLAAAQLLPFLDMLAHSQRDRHFGAGVWPMPLWGAANFFVPRFFTFSQSQNVFFQYNQYWTSSYYTGIATVTLAMLAVWRVRSGRVWLLAAVCAAMVVFAMGERALLYDWLKKALPIFGFIRYPVKFVALVVFLLPLLAAFGIAALRSAEPAQARRCLLGCAAITLAVIGVILGFGRFRPLYSGDYNLWPETLISGCSRAALLVGVGLIFVGLQRATRPSIQRLLGISGLLLVFLDMATHLPRQNPTVPHWVYEPIGQMREWTSTPQFGESRAMTSPIAESKLHRQFFKKAEEDAMRKRLGLYSNCNLIDEIPKVSGSFSLHIREAAQFENLLYATNRLYGPVMDFLGVSQVTEPGKTMGWMARTNYLPLVTAGQSPVFSDRKATLRGLLDPSFDPRKTLFLPLEAGDAVLTTNQANIRIVPQKITAHELVFDAEADAPGWVVIAQSYYRWWKASVGDTPAPLWRANHAFQALEIPGGRHRVRLVYRDQSFHAGIIISLLTLAGCGMAWFRPGRRGGKPE